MQLRARNALRSIQMARCCSFSRSMASVGESREASFLRPPRREPWNHCVIDFPITRVDGLKGFREAIENLYPQAQVRLLIVGLVRNSLRYVRWKARRVIALDLRRSAR